MQIIWREDLPRLPLFIVVRTPFGVDSVAHLGIEGTQAAVYQFCSYRTPNVTKQLHDGVSSNRTPLLLGKPDSFGDTGAAFHQGVQRLCPAGGFKMTPEPYSSLDNGTSHCSEVTGIFPDHHIPPPFLEPCVGTKVNIQFLLC